MRRTTKLFSSLALAALMSGSAIAADLDQIINAPQEDPYVPVEIGTGWYIRGDISYDMETSSSGSYRTYGVASAGPPITYAYGSADYDNFDYQATGDGSVGVGYQFNSFLRGDVTAGYWKRHIVGTDTDLTPCSSAFPAAVGCRSTDRSTLKAWELMANGYADLGTFIGVTPYLGGGLGMTRLSYGALSNVAECYDATGAAIAGCGYTATHPGANSWRFTWALMAGASYDLSKNLKFDLGYRYAHTSGGDMFGFDAPTAALGATGVQGTEDGFSTHQIKAGVRYSIW
ncbi:MAG: outer membrane beta-barrel protein [Rhizobiaceae bacterium]